MAVPVISDDEIQDASTRPPTTPENNPTVLPTSISKEPPLSVHTEASNFEQTYERRRVADEMDSEMVACDLATFQRHYMPFVPDKANVDACVRYLETNGILVRDTSSNRQRWAAFEKKPSDLQGPEEVIFQPLNDIGVAIVRYNWQLDKTRGTDGVRQPGFTFKQPPTRTTLSEIKGSNYPVDGFFMPFGHSGPTGGIASTPDVAAAAEFKAKMTDSTVKDNREKVVGAANHVMNNDPRRMFTYGITIEDEQLTLWYFCRSHSAKSAGFNFFTDIRSFVSIFLSFIFATEQEMGYDPTVHRYREGDTIAYVYEVTKDNRTRYFKTIDSLSEYRGNCITGRMTRVWKVTEVVSIVDLSPCIESPCVVLKDLWLSQGADTERNIQTAIFEDIETFGANAGEDPVHFSKFKPHMVEELRCCFRDQAYKKYFLEIICDHQGHVSKSVPPPAKVQPGIFVSTSLQHRSQTPTRTFVPKQQYRVVFKEVCEPLHRVEKLSDVIGAVRQSLVALQLLYCAGWVHRDISSGNLLLYKSDNVVSGKLADLEYAKRFPSDTSTGDPTTGTPHFMPFEIQTQEHLFRDLGHTDIEEIMETYGLLPSTSPPLGPVRYNFQHDIESLWWIILWFLTTRVNCDESQKWAKYVFQNTLVPSPERRAVFGPDKILDLQRCLHVSLRPMAIYMIGEQISLLINYSNREKARLIDDLASYSVAYMQMDYALSNIHDMCDGVPDLVVPPRPSPVVNKLHGKRNHPDGDASEYQPSKNGEKHQDHGPCQKKRIVRS